VVIDLGLTYEQYGELTPREVSLLYERREKLREERLDEIVLQAWWNGLFCRWAANNPDDYPMDVRDFLPSLAEERAEAKKRERESWTFDDCKRAVGLM